MPAIMVTRCVHKHLGPLHVADTQILSISPDGAQQFGYETARALAGRYMSDLQDRDWRQAGHQRYLDRKLGRELTPDYPVMIRRPDGEQVGQRREFGGWMESVYGEDIYLTFLHPTKELDHGPTIRTLTRTEKRHAKRWNGDCTVADLRVMLATDTLPLALSEGFRHIIRECDELSSGLFAGKHASALDLALSDDVAVCWYGAKTSSGSLVRPRFRCERCGFGWQGWAKRQSECTACGKIYRRYDAYDKG